MAKPKNRAYSRYATQAAKLLGLAIREARIRRRITTTEAAERVGISRGLIQRIENGEMGCTVGAIFELAAIVGVPLFDAEETTLTRALINAQDKASLLPKRASKGASAVSDDF